MLTFIRFCCKIVIKGGNALRKYSSKFKKWHDNKCRKMQHNKKSKKVKSRLCFSPKTHTITAPKCFSLMNNREDTENFFEKIISIYNNKRSAPKRSRDTIVLDFKNVDIITPEALMYLIAITSNLKYVLLYFLSIRCHLPQKESVKKVFYDSGFWDYVNGNNRFKITPQDSAVQILSGSTVDSSVVAKTIDFIKSHSNCDAIVYRNLYTMLIEIMANTIQHDYKNTDFVKLYNWYLYVEVKENVNITILDIGEGIPSTVARRFWTDTFYSLTQYKSSYLISSALDGKFRTETKQEYRGKGLPHILECYENKYINNLCIISGTGSVQFNGINEKRKFYDSREKFLGTIFQISIKNGG